MLKVIINKALPGAPFLVGILTWLACTHRLRCLRLRLARTRAEA